MDHFNFITMSKSIIFTIGSRPTMADKILRRTSYGGEQTDSLGKYIEIYHNWNFFRYKFLKNIPTQV